MVFAGTANAGVIRKPPINLGLVGYWSFDVGKGGLTAVDQSGNGNTGTLTNMDANSDWVDGKLGQALDFNGVNQNVKVPDSASLRPANITVSAWVKMNAPSSASILVVKRYANAADPYNSYILDAGSSSTYRFCLSDGTSGSQKCIGSTTATNSEWKHVVGTYDGANQIIYINGIAETSSTTSLTIGYSSLALQMGEWGSGWDFNGSIDEVRIYNRALSAAEVARLYRLQKPKILTPNNNGLVGYWSFNEGAGGYAGDMSGNGNTGTLTNMDASTDWVPGKLGQALDFDGSNDYVDVGNPGISFAEGSISSWIRTGSSTATGNGIVYTGYGSGQSEYIGYLILNGNIRIDIDDGDNGCARKSLTSSGYNYTDSAWHHIVLTFVAQATGRLYIDGTEKGSGVSLLACESEINPSANWVIGDVASGDNFLGLIDEVRIYNRALSAAEVKGLYNASALAKINTSPRGQLTNGLVGYWTFDGPDLSFTTNLATDVSGNGNNGRLTNMSTSTAPTIGRLGQALNFDGSNDYVSVGDSNGLSPTNITLSAWVKSANVWSGVGSGFVSKRVGFQNNDEYNLFYWNVGTNGAGFYSRIGGQSSAGTYAYYIVTPATSDWIHIASTFDGTTIRIYYNGVAAGTTGSPPSGISNGSASLNIGALNSGTSHFTGPIDEVRIYNRALSASEITRLYNMGR
ncbi:LamG domain-containing protein [Candidatus Uhrbacteria bacterium]|nr:LamG domain-containing protein [Candidatus Uhrbacteria bacterium]